MEEDGRIILVMETLKRNVVQNGVRINITKMVTRWKLAEKYNKRKEEEEELHER